MKRYKVLSLLGDGTYGSVVKAQNIETGEMVAIKKMKRKFESWKDCLNHSEVQVLTQLRHPNVVQLKEVIREENSLYFVFEYLHDNLYHIIRDLPSSGFSESQIRNMMYQITQGCRYIHKKGFFHRDLKLENILFHRARLKICDFGLAKKIRSSGKMTEYVSTRWYRAPEVVLKWKYYNFKIDIWALGCIMAELFLLSPIFPGNSATDQLYKITRLLGTPTKNIWNEGLEHARKSGFQFPSCRKIPLKQIIPNASHEAIELMEALLQWDPKKRPDSSKVLNYPFFSIGCSGNRFVSGIEEKQNDVNKDPNRSNSARRRPKKKNNIFQY